MKAIKKFIKFLELVNYYIVKYQDRSSSGKF